MLDTPGLLLAIEASHWCAGPAPTAPRVNSQGLIGLRGKRLINSTASAFEVLSPM